MRWPWSRRRPHLALTQRAVPVAEYWVARVVQAEHEAKRSGDIAVAKEKLAFVNRVLRHIHRIRVVQARAAARGA